VKRLRCIFALILFSATLCFAQKAELAPNENLVVEGVPKIPQSLVETVDRYTNFRNAYLDSWDPVARELLISTRFADTNQIHRLTMPGGARTQLTFYTDAVAGASYPPKPQGFFIFSKDVGGGEFFQLYRYDTPSGDATLLTDGKSRNTSPKWSNAGDRIAYGSTRRTGNDVDVYVVNPSDPKSDHLLVQLQGGGWQVLDWSPDDKKILLVDQLSANQSFLWIADAATGEKSLLTPQNHMETVSYDGGQFSADGKGIYTTTDRDSEFHRLTYIDLASKQPTYLTTQIAWDVDDFDLSSDGEKLAFVTNEDGFGILHVVDTKSGKEKPLPALPKGIISDVRWHQNSRDLGFDISSARATSDVYSLDIQTGEVSRWTYSETGGVNASQFPEPELIHWKAEDGKTISGFLYRPPAKFAGKRPVIINIHGGPEGQSRPGFLGRSNYYLDELGVAIIYPNVRGSTGYGKSFLAADNGFQREASYHDIGSLLDWIQTQTGLDSSKVLVTGGSYGGFMTLAVATTYNDRICCSVDVVGPSNLVTFLEHTSGYRQDLRRVEYGDERDPKMREFLERIAPMNKAKNITKPLFVVAGKNDPRVPASESQQMVTKVRENGTPVWWLMANDEGHGFRKKINQDFQFYATVMFMKEYLLK
jgi:dipeptidyl aminopeptidase/acylaminoacyl peptidase